MKQVGERTWGGRKLARPIATVAIAWALGPACTPPPGFACAGDDQCRTEGGALGVCFGVGACGYPDPACESGYRYSAHAPSPWTDSCVVPDDSPGTTSTGPVDASSSDGIAGDESTSAEPTTTGPTLPECGNGIVEADEFCDDGNEIESDGCNPDCRESGVEIASFNSMLEEEDVALDVHRLDSGDLIIAGFSTAGGSDRQAYVARYTIDGTLIWQTFKGGSANSNDYATGVVAGPDDSVRVAGWIVPSAPMDVTPRAQMWLAELDLANGDIRWEDTDGGGPPDNDYFTGLVGLPDGDIVAVGRIGPSSTSNFAVRRYTVNKAGDGLNLVWSRGIDGGGGFTDLAQGVAYDPTGRIVVGGATEPTDGDFDRRMMVFDPEGNDLRPPCVDSGGDDPLAADDRIFDVDVTPDGAIVAVGRATKDADDGTDAWIGYYPVGECEPAWVKTHLDDEGGSGEDDAATAVGVDSLGRIVAVGFIHIGNGDDAWIAKYEPDGTLLWELDRLDGPGNGTDRFEAVTFGDDREIIVAGQIADVNTTDVWVARYTP